MDSSSAKRRWPRSSLWLLPPVAAGLLLRGYGLSRQVMAGDELHAVRAALSMPLREILVTYLPSDHCIPLSAFYRALTGLGLELTELHLRLPVLASAVLVLWLVPWWVARRCGRSVAWPLAWLLALSPAMVYYSRIVRSYMPIVLLGFAAVAAFERWYRRPTWGGGAAYVLAAGLAIYFHPVAAPFVLSPFLFLAGAELVGRRWRRWKPGALLAGVVVLAVAAFVVPAWPSLERLIELKHQPLQGLSWSTWRAVLSLESGTAWKPLIVAFWILALVGLGALLLRRPSLGFYGATLAAGHLAGVLLLSPHAMDQPNILNRYLLVALPVVFLWIAVAVSRLSSPLAGHPALRALAGCLLPVALFAAGPLTDPVLSSSSFAHRAAVTTFYTGQRLRVGRAPEIYSRLDPANEGALVEYPWHPMWMFSGIFPRYEGGHGREVIVAPGERVLWDPRLNFRNMVPPDAERILATRAAYLVVHLDSRGEDAAFDRPLRRNANPRALRTRKRRDGQLGKLDRKAAEKAAAWTELWGPPDLTGDGILIWDLRRIRDEKRPR